MKTESIYRIKGFLPYIVVIFLNAFTDLGHKIVIQNTVFKIYDGETQIILTAIINMLMLIPFIMFFSPSGFVGDRYSKSLVMRWLALAAIVITLLITLCYYLGQFELAFGLTFLLALQATFYSPAKYGYIKELVGNRHITMGNGVVQAVTTTSILGGIFVYSILFERYLEGVHYTDTADILRSIAPVGWMLVFGSTVEFLLAYRMPNIPRGSKKSFSVSKYYRFEYLKENVSTLRQNHTIFVSIIGLSLFWGVSQVVLSVFPEYAKDSLGITNTVLVQGMMAIAGLGIIVGSLLAGKVSRHYIEIGTIPLGAIGITLSLFFVPHLTNPVAHMFNFFIFGVASGLFIVPLNAMIQYHSLEHELSTVLAGNNFMQNIVMFAFLVLTVLFALMGLRSVGLLYLMLLFSLAGSLYLLWKIPQSLVQFLTLSLVSVRFRLQVLGLDHLPPGGGVLLLGNHISWVDWALVQMASPRRVRFVMERSIYEKRYLKRFLDFFGVIPVSAQAMKEAKFVVERLLKAGEVVCIFPEGTISRNGHLGEFKKGFERMVGDADALIVPFYLRGLWGDPLSRSSDRLKELRRRRRNDVMIAFGAPMPIDTDAKQIKKKLFELSYTSWDQYTLTLPTLPEAWIKTAKSVSAPYCLVDWGGEKLSYTAMLAQTLLYSKKIKGESSQRVGILMPSGGMGTMINMAVLMTGKEVVSLNYMLSPEEFHRQLHKSGVKTIYLSSMFLAKLKSKGIDFAPLLDGIKVIDIESENKKISKTAWIAMLAIARILPTALLRTIYLKKHSNEDTAVLFFSSGTECEPKGVMLTHRNIIANITQMFDLLNIKEDDVLLSILPYYHPMGLVEGSLFGLLSGLPVVCCPDPTDDRKVAMAAARHKATILFATPKLYQLYANSRKIEPLMFGSLRVAISGMGKLDLGVKSNFEEKYKLEILEGYGATESTSLASVNIPDTLETQSFTVQIGKKRGTAGMPLPGTAFRIVDPKTLEELESQQEGQILIGGAQVMKGYLDEPERTASVIVSLDGLRWYKSGDRGYIDKEGFLTFVDRCAHFDKAEDPKERSKNAT